MSLFNDIVAGKYDCNTGLEIREYGRRDPLP
jgi:hypothetical protein